MIPEALICLALAVHYEARGETHAGQLAVARVVLNRAWGRRGDVCVVTFAPHQFSPLHQRGRAWHLRHLPHGRAWRAALAVARAALRERVAFARWPDEPRSALERATHFHAEGACPSWSAVLQYIGCVGEHHFYWPHPRGYAVGPGPCLPRGITL